MRHLDSSPGGFGARRTLSVFLFAVLFGSAACDHAAPHRPTTASAEQAVHVGKGDHDACESCDQHGAPKAPGSGETASSEIYKVPAGPSAVRGKATAKLTLVVFSDFECPFCKKVSATIDQVMQEYGDELRVVFKHRPLAFHEHALQAALAAEAAGEQGKFWEMQDRLFKDTQALTQDRLAVLAAELGLDVSRFRAALEDPRLKQRVKDDGEQAERLGVLGTPTLFINGRKVMGARSFAVLKPILDEELQKANALVRKGIAPAALYDTLIKDGRTSASPPSSEPAAPAPEQDRTIYKIDIGRAPTRGPEGAPITVVVFSDFQCPFCKRVEPTMQALDKEFPGKLRLVWKNFPLPFHDKAKGAASAALAAHEQGQFWAMHDRLFENQRALDRESLEGHAQKLGLDLPRFRAALDGTGVSAAIAEEIKQGQAASVQGTPTIFVNGRRIAGAQPLSTLRTIVQQELAREPRGG